MGIPANPCWCAKIRSAQNDQQEEPEHNIRQQAGPQGVPSRRVVGIGVGGETGAEVKAGFAARDDKQYAPGGNRP
jgi:hypothetical protein